MMKIFALLAGIALTAFVSVASAEVAPPADTVTDYTIEKCKVLLTKAEETPDDAPYDACGFDDEIRAWNTWAPLASSRDMRRALFELCRRYPNHQYGPLYCQKAMDLNYGPALAYQGFLHLRGGEVDKALMLFTDALKTGEVDEADTVRITETLGLLYVTEGSPYYNPESGAALLSKASGERSAVANNALGYIYFAGKTGLKPDMKESFTCFWRAILLGCPAAEENVGLFQLARQGKITMEDAIKYMAPQAFTCTPTPKVQPETQKRQKLDCPCKDIYQKDDFFQELPYLYTGLTDGDRAILQDKNGKSVTVSKGAPLGDGMFVSEIRPRAVILLQNGARIIINRYHTGECVDYCLDLRANPPKPEPVTITPYRLTFTQRECQDLLYYASYLVDTSLPYVGQAECDKYAPKEVEVDEATRLLLGIETKEESEQKAEDAIAAAKKAAGIK